MPPRAESSFRFEATALSAVPFLGTLADRPFVSSVDRVLAIVNGTSNYLLTSLAEPGATFAQAVARAQELGFAEPDPSRDLDGLDASDKLLLLTSLFGWGRLSREALEVRGIRDITADDLAAARSAGGAIKAVVSAERDAAGVRAFVGPVFLPATEPLASLTGALNGIRLDGRHVSNLFFSGPGAGPDVTAATLLDDAVQAVVGREADPSPAGAVDQAGVSIIARHVVVRARHVSRRVARGRRGGAPGHRLGPAGRARRRALDGQLTLAARLARRAGATSTPP